MVYICSKGALDSYYLRSCRCFWPRFPSPPVKYLNVALHGSQKSIDIRINFAYDPTLQAIRSPRKRQFGVDWFWCFEELTLSLVHNIYYLTYVVWFAFLCGWINCFRSSVKVMYLWGLTGLLVLISMIYIYEHTQSFALVHVCLHIHVYTHTHFNMTNGVLTVTLTYLQLSSSPASY